MAITCTRRSTGIPDLACPCPTKRSLRRSDSIPDSNSASNRRMPPRAPGAVVAKVYWTVPEWCRAVARKLVPVSIRAQLLRTLQK
jgi:hypothetical protein